MTHVTMVIAAMMLSATAASISMSRDAQPGAQAKAPTGQACFNFSEATTFKALDNDTIRVSLITGNDVDVDLSGAQCGAIDALKNITIQVAPVRRICIGEAHVSMRLSFRDPASAAPIRCTIAAVRAAEGAKPKK